MSDTKGYLNMELLRFTTAAQAPLGELKEKELGSEEIQ